MRRRAGRSGAGFRQLGGAPGAADLARQEVIRRWRWTEGEDDVDTTWTQRADAPPPVRDPHTPGMVAAGHGPRSHPVERRGRAPFWGIFGCWGTIRYPSRR